MWFRFAVPQFHIESIRSVHTDTLYASVSLQVLNENGGLHFAFPATTWPLGDKQGKQTVTLSLPVPPVDVPPPSTHSSDGGSVSWAFMLNNTGHKDSGWITVANKAADALAGAAAGKALDGGIATPAGLAALGGILAIQELINLLTANCDGNVAAFAQSFTCKQLIARCVPRRPWTWVDGNPGSESPSGCGDKSKYDVTYLIEEAPAPPGPPSTAPIHKPAPPVIKK